VEKERMADGGGCNRERKYVGERDWKMRKKKGKVKEEKGA